MNSDKQSTPTTTQNGTPIFASPWIALFVVLRRELTQAFAQR
jgi:hypothetical protein